MLDLFRSFIEVIFFPISPEFFTLETNVMWQFMLLILLAIGFISLIKQILRGFL